MLKLSKAERSFDMVSNLWGKKIGMTQVFSDNKVVPVTVIDTAHWFITNIKKEETDGYNAVQVGCLRKRYHDESFSVQWLKNLKKYFVYVKEIPQDALVKGMTAGQPLSSFKLEVGNHVDIFGTTRGRGFQGAVKRHGFAGGPSSHGSMFKRRPGSMSFMRSRGRVIKGKKLPGHMGVEQRVMKNLEVIKVDADAHLVLVKGSVPGHAGSLIFIKKTGAE
jgi:large subunit ribosomal protein L3